MVYDLLVFMVFLEIFVFSVNLQRNNQKLKIATKPNKLYTIRENF